jgi:hypothetical protein
MDLEEGNESLRQGVHQKHDCYRHDAICPRSTHTAHIHIRVN